MHWYHVDHKTTPIALLRATVAVAAVSFAMASALPVGATGTVTPPRPAAATRRVTPQDATAQWTNAGPYADDATAVAVSPTFDADHTVFLGVSSRVDSGGPNVQATAGVLRSLDGGTTWTTVYQHKSDLGTTQAWLGQIAVSPTFSADHTVFAEWAEATGGIVRSIDGGASFQPVTVGTDKFFAQAKTISMSPAFATDHMVAVTANLTNVTTSYLSTDGGSTWHPVDVSGKDSCTSSVGGGGGYVLVLGGGTLGSYLVNDSAVCSNNTNIRYAVSHDSGATWAKSGDIQAAVNAVPNNFDSQHSRMYAAPGGSTIIYTDQYGNVVRSADSGQTWHSVIPNPTLGNDSPPGSFASPGPYFTFQFQSASSVYAVHEWSKLDAPHLYHSADGGVTWSLFWQAQGSTALHDATQAGANTLFFAAGNEGLLRSTDLGQTWKSVGTFSPQVPAVVTSPNYASDHTVFTVSFPDATRNDGQDTAGFGISRSTTGGATWSEPEASNPIVGPDGFGTIFTTSVQGGMSMAVSPNFANDHTVFEGDRIGVVNISHDGGRTWAPSLFGTPLQVGWYVNAIALSPNFATDQVVYQGGGPGGFGVFKSNDGGLNWGQITPLDRINEVNSDMVHGLAIAAEPSGVLDTAIAMGPLFLMRDNPADKSRVEFSDAGRLGTWAVAMSPNYLHDCTLYVAQWPGPSGIAATIEDGIYMSTNACIADADAGTTTWTRLTAALPMRDFDTIALSPNFLTDHTLFIGSYSSGVFVSTDSGQTWSNLSTGLGDLTVHQLSLAATGPQTATLFAATDSGVWQTPVSLAPSAVPPTPTAAMLDAPQRLVDTRSSGGMIAAGQSQCFTLAGKGGVPLTAAGVILNVTAVSYGDYGWLTLYPAGQAVPATSTVNFDVHEYAIANGAVVKLGTGGQVCVSAGRSATNVVLDATGYLPGSSGQLQLLPQPQRLVDTRTDGGPIAAGASRCFAISGLGSIPSSAAAVVANVTAVGYSNSGWLSLYPNGQAVPTTSSVNFDTTQYAIANWAFVGLGTGGQLCVNAGRSSSDVIVDATGYLASGEGGQVTMLASPQRAVDTRTSGGLIGAGQSRCFTLAGQSGVPSTAASVVLNVTAVGYTDFGWATLYPAGQAVPSTSSLNFDTHEYAVANGAVVKLGSGGQICVQAGRSATHIVVDVAGYLS